MTSLRRKLLFRLYVFSDIFILVASLLFAAWITANTREMITLGEFLSMRIEVINLIGFVVIVFIWHVVFKWFQLYRSRRKESEIIEWKDILKATTYGTTFFLLMGYFFDISAFSPLFLGVFWIMSTTLTLSFRIIMRLSLKKIRLFGRNLRFILIVGTNSRAHKFASEIEERQELGYRILGYIDQNIHQNKEGINLLGTLEDFPRIIKNHIVDEVIIALPVKSYYEQIQDIVQKGEEQGISINYLSDIFNTKIARSKTEDPEDLALMTINSGYQDSWQYVTKRILDIVISVIIIIATLPLMVIAAVTMKINSPGPILFVQQRVGYNKRIFRLYKFRTMIKSAEDLQGKLEEKNEMDGPVFKIYNDPRVTQVGRILRKASIDELPQLFNILKGDMSLVGPRPLPVRDYSGFDKDWQRRRFSVLPGLTCTWQINGRNDVPFEDWMKMDMEYIDNWKLFDDIKILCKTIPAVIKGKGAA